ncbi:MAG: DMT family transporter [Alphaproteobacteria bacterium]
MSGVATPDQRMNRPLMGILAIESTAFVFSFQDAVVKLLSDTYSLWQIVCIRSLVAGLILLTIVVAARGRVSLRSHRPGLQILRGSLMFASYTLYYLGIVSMPIVDGAALFFSAPLFITVISIPLLGEHVGIHRGVAVVVGFVGVLIMLRPGFQSFGVAALLPLLGAAIYAYTAIITRRLGDTDSSFAITFYTTVMFGLGGVIGSALGVMLFPNVEGAGMDALLVRAWTMPSAWDLAIMATFGATAALGHWGISHAYRIAPVSVIAPFEYTYLAWVALVAYLIWGEVPSDRTLWGMALVVGGGLYVMWREAGKQKA